jgi:hypothetical protein
MAIDGGHAVVGAPGDDDHGSDSGSAYLFVRSAEGWVQSATPPPAPPVVSPSATELAPGDSFGGSAAISGDYIVVGAPGTPISGPGSSCVFERSGDNWNQVRRFAPDVAGDDAFGMTVDIDGAMPS